MNEQKITELMDSLTIEQTDALLGKVEIEPDFRVARRLVKRTNDKVSGRKNRHFRWLAPVAACVCAAVVIGTAVPSVRAAVTQWFQENSSVQNYVAQPSEQRQDTPELEGIINQTMPEQAEGETVNNIELADVVPEWQEWAGDLNPTIGDIYYDGRELIVGFDMGGGAAEFLNDVYWDQQHMERVWFGDKHTVDMNGEKYDYSVRTEAMWEIYDKYSQFMVFKSLDDKNAHLSEEGWEVMKNAKSMPFTATIDFSEEPLQLEGIQTMEIELPILTSDHKDDKYTEDGRLDGRAEKTEIGKVKMLFSFDPQAGKDNVQTYEINQSKNFEGEGKYCWMDRESESGYVTLVNKTADLSDVKMTVSHMDVFKAGGELYVELTMPDDWNKLDKENFINNMIPVVSADGNRLSSSGTAWLEQAGVDTVMRIAIDMLPSEIQATEHFKVMPVITYFTDYHDAEYVEGEPTKIPSEEMTGYEVEDVELENCAIEFNLGE